MAATKRKFAATLGLLINSSSTVDSSVASTSPSTGAFVVSGGVGIGGDLNVAGNITGTAITATNSMFVDNSYGSVTLTQFASIFAKAIGANATSLMQVKGNDGTVGMGMRAITGGNSLIYSNNALEFRVGSTIRDNDVPSGGTTYMSLSTTGVLALSSSTASTSTTAGALTVSGGAGIAKSLSIGGRLQLFNGANYTAFVSSASGNTVYTLPATSPATGTSVLQSDTAGVLSWVPMTATGSTSSGAATTSQNINVVGAGSSNLAHSILFTPIASSSGSAVSSDTTFSFNPSTEILSVSGLAVTAATGSSNTTTGAFVVTGGVGIGGSLNVNNKTRFNDEVYINSLSSNAFYISGSGSVAYTWSVGSTLSSSRYFLGLDLGLHPVGGNQSVIQTFHGMQLVGNSLSTPAGYTATAVGSANAFGVLIPIQQAASVGLAVIAHASQTGDLQIWTTPSGLATTTYLAVKSNGQLYSYASIASTNTTTGALVVTGGVGIGQSVSVAGRLQMFNGANYTAFVSSASGSTVYTLPATSPATGSSVLQSTAGGVMSWVPMTAGASSGNTSQNIVVNAAGNANVFHPVLFTPSSLSAGSAVSSDLTITFNPSTEILNVSGLAITAGTASTNNVTGALVVRGGLGVSGQLSFVSASMGFTGITYNPTMAFIGNTSSSPITLTVLTDNSLNWEGSQGAVFSIDSNLSSGEIFSVSDISGLPIISASAGQTVTFNEFGGYTQFGNGTINSSSTSTGSIVIAGGLGMTGNANIGGTVRITNTTATTSSSSGALTVTGGAGIAQSLFVGGNIVLSNNIYSGGNTFTKSGQAAGDIIFDNGANDTAGLLYYYRNNTNFGLDVYAVGIGATRFRIVKDLNESGGSELWSIDRSGVVTRSGWAVGETINTRMYNFSDLNMAATTTISSTSYTTFATITYTPLSSTSYLWIEFSCTYNIAGAAADDFWSNIEVNGTEIVNAQQFWTNGAGGGTRSGVMFPLAARYTNSGTAGIAISVRSKRGTSDDNATIYGNSSSGFMRIQEIGR